MGNDVKVHLPKVSLSKIGQTINFSKLQATLENKLGQELGEKIDIIISNTFNEKSVLSLNSSGRSSINWDLLPPL